MTVALPELDVKVLGALANRDGPVSIQALAGELGVDQSKVSATCVVQSRAGNIAIEERKDTELRLGPRGRCQGRRRG